MAKLVDAADSKSAGSNAVPVRLRFWAPWHGVLAQLGERYAGSVEVRGSNPLRSTICKQTFR